MNVALVDERVSDRGRAVMCLASYWSDCLCSWTSARIGLASSCSWTSGHVTAAQFPCRTPTTVPHDPSK